MKALTVKNPYAAAVATGTKDVENRTRLTSYRGDIAIHAGAAWHRTAGLDQNILAWWAHFYGGELDAAYMAPAQFRTVVAVAELYDCHVPAPGCCSSMWADRGVGAHWLLRDVRRLETPVPARGALGLWMLPADVERAVVEQLPTLAVPL